MTVSADKTIADKKQWVGLGRITSPFGVKGWVKVYSYTEPMENIFQYHDWHLKSRQGYESVAVEEAKPHGKGLVVRLKDCHDRDAAIGFCQRDIFVPKADLEGLPEGEYYWHQLQGLTVVSCFEGSEYCLGKVKNLMETGSNDVLVVAPFGDSIDDRERLLPYIPEQFVLSVDLQQGLMTVNWDPEF